MTFPPLPEPYTLAQRAASKLARTLPGDDLTPIIEALQEYIAPVLAERDALKVRLQDAQGAIKQWVCNLDYCEAKQESLREQVRALEKSMTPDEIRAEFLRWKANLIHTEVFTDEEWSAAWVGWYACALTYLAPRNDLTSPSQVPT